MKLSLISSWIALCYGFTLCDQKHSLNMHSLEINYLIISGTIYDYDQLLALNSEKTM